MDYTHWRQADTMEVNFKGHKGDQDQKGNVRVRTRDEISGPRAGYRADSGGVALLVELLSCHATLPADAPLSSYRSGREVMAVKYSQALRAIREVGENAGRNPKDLLYIRYALKERPPWQPGRIFPSGDPE